MEQPTACETRWKAVESSFHRNYEELQEKTPDCQEELELLRCGLRTIGQLIHTSPSVNGNGRVWKELIMKAEAERTVLSKHLDGKALFTAVLRLYVATHRELRETLVPEEKEIPEEFREQRRRKRNPSDEQPKKSKPTPGPRDPRIRSQVEVEVPTKNFYAPLRISGMEVVEETTNKPDAEQQPSTSKTGRPPPIVLTSTTNLMQLQRQVKNIVTGSFEFRNTRRWTRIVTKEMADFSAIRKHLENHNFSYFTFFPKSEKPVKAVIHHLPQDTPAEDISDGLMGLGFDVINVRQMTATRRTAPEGTHIVSLPLFLVTLPRTAKSQDVFKLINLCHIAIRVEAYKAQNGLTQCYNCHQFGHVWANCKQPSRCLWCGGGHLHKECPEKGNSSSSPACCNCRLAEGEKPHPSNYRGCRDAKEEMQRRQSQRTPKTPAGRVFSTKLATPGVSFAAALKGNPEEDQRQRPARQVSVAAPASAEPRATKPLRQQKSQPTGQLVQAPLVNSQPIDNMLKVLTVVQQIMTEVSGAQSQEEQIGAITKIVLKLMNQNGH
jgi:hypothetical protein